MEASSDPVYFWNAVGQHSVASSSKQGNMTLLAAMKPVPHSNRRRFMPFANAVMAAQHAGWTMKLDQTTRYFFLSA